MEWITTFLEGLSFEALYGGILRFVFPILSILILGRCAKALLTFQREPEYWAYVVLPGGDRLPVTHWETLLGRGKNCDLVLDYPTISRSHAVLTRYDDGSWSISDVGSKGGVEVNGTAVRSCALEYGDTISLGGVKVTLVPFSREQESRQAAARTLAGRQIRPAITLFYLTLFQP